MPAEQFERPGSILGPQLDAMRRLRDLEDHRHSIGSQLGGLAEPHPFLAPRHQLAQVAIGDRFSSAMTLSARVCVRSKRLAIKVAMRS